MKRSFPAYYRIHQEDLLERFDDCVFMFDASALLDIFRLKKELTEEVFSVLENYKDKIYIPFHVAEEYNKDIHKVLKDQIKSINDSKTNLETFISSLRSRRSFPYLSESTFANISKLKGVVEKEYEEQTEYLKTQLVKGELQNRMADLLDGRVLEKLTTEDITSIEQEGKDRYANKVPPGWKDAAKGDNRYGDLINWKEILKFAKNHNQSVIFVANDEKEDWVIKENGRTICPQYQLLAEFYSNTGNIDQLFHIYTLDSFLNFLKEHDKSAISDETVKGVKDYMETGFPFVVEGGDIKFSQLSYTDLFGHEINIPGFDSYQPYVNDIKSISPPSLDDDILFDRILKASKKVTDELPKESELKTKPVSSKKSQDDDGKEPEVVN